MPVTVREAIALPALAVGDPVVLGGEAGLDAVLRWVHVSEVHDVGRVLSGDELVLTTGLYLLVVAQGRWRPATRWAWIALTASIAVQLGWHARYGAIFQDPRTDQVLIPFVAAAAGLTMIACGIETYREYTRVRPAPQPTQR